MPLYLQIGRALSGPAFLLKVPPETRPNKVLLSKALG
jgi:hypothetical protein